MVGGLDERGLVLVHLDQLVQVLPALLGSGLVLGEQVGGALGELPGQPGERASFIRKSW